MHKLESVLENGANKILLDFKILINHFILVVVIWYQNHPCRIMLYSHMQIHAEHNDTMKTSEDERRRATLFLEKYTSHFIWKVRMCERELEIKQNCNILTSPAPPDIAVCRSRSPGLLNRGLGAQPLWDMFSSQLILTNWSLNCSGVPRAPPAGWWLPLPLLVSNSSDLRLLVSKLTEFLSSPSYIIVQSPTQSLEWYVWSSSSGNNCHVVHRSLSSGASVYECTMGFYLVSFVSQARLRDFFS